MNIRWDAVVTPSRRAAKVQTWVGDVIDDPGAGEGEAARINVWLYGTLAMDVAERPVRLQLPAPFSTDMVIRELGRRLGDAFRERVLDADGRKLCYCRIFVDGAEVEDPMQPIRAGAAPATVEMILLTAIEGG